MLKQGMSALQGSGKRARGGEHSSLDMSDEVGLWSEALRLVNAALKLSGAFPLFGFGTVSNAGADGWRLFTIAEDLGARLGLMN